MDSSASQGDTPAASSTESTVRLERRVAELEAGLAAATSAREQVEKILARERIQLNRSFELFERDRRLIGFELHDGIVQDLTAALMYLESGMAELIRLGAPSPESLATCERLIGGCIDEARRLMNGLQPPMLSEQGLQPALDALAIEVQQRGVTDVVLNIDPTLGTLAPPLEVAVYRIVQESLSNVWQHSRAQRATVTIRVQNQTVTIEVIDTGIGFAVDEVRSNCYGLIGIRQRATLFGGEAHIESRPGRGTTVRASLPLD